MFGSMGGKYGPLGRRTLGEMSASIAHEVNQPLAAIITNAEATLRLLSRDVLDIQDARAGIADVIKDAHRASEVIRRIRDFSKKAHPQMMQLNVNDVVEEAVKLVRHEALRHGVTIRSEFASGLPPVQCVLALRALGVSASTAIHSSVGGMKSGARAAYPQPRSSSANGLVAKIRPDPKKSVRPFKGIFCPDISEFESHMPSHAVGSLPANMRRSGWSEVVLPFTRCAGVRSRFR
jgi:hypothetical protein